MSGRRGRQLGLRTAETQRRVQAVRMMRKRGLTFDQIGEQLGVSRAAAHYYWRIGL